jgi:hypothetical protein
MDDGDHIVEFGDIISIRALPDVGRLSHITYFGTPSAPVPEPSTMLLLGVGIVGLAGFKKKFKG